MPGFGAAAARGWWLLRRVWVGAGRDHVPLLASGVAYSMVLALLPALAAVLALSGLVTQPTQVDRQHAAPDRPRGA